jgi:hypothetical protein
MKRALAFGILALVAACSHKKEQPAAYSGPISFERINKMRDAVHVGEDWDDAVARIAAEVGTPTTKTDSLAVWALDDGTSCAYVAIERKDDHVTSSSSQPKIDKASFTEADNNYTRCAAKAKR